jgi:hypothetical protein
MTKARRICAGAAAAALLLTSHGIALADNTNDNSNTNTNSDAGGYLGAGAGSDESTGWPPTKADWPPSDISTGGLVEDSGKGGESGKATPIVMPDGQAAPPKADSDGSTSTSTTPTPIVPAGG